MLLHNQIEEYCIKFKLNGILNHYQALSQIAVDNKLSYIEFLLKLLEYEAKIKDERSKQTLLKFASFPKIKSIEEFDFKYSSVDKTLINELLTLRFIDEAKNILLLGPSGVGKTHLAIAIGIEATKHKFKTKFITTSDLLLQLESATITNSLESYLKRVIYPNKLLIIDEFGYIKLNENQANLFFQIINKCYERNSIIITSNLIFTKWKEVLNNDEALTTAILDRLIHHSHLINITGESYRLKQKKEAGLITNLSNI
jgi:DNA replication protein DnaC